MNLSVSLPKQQFTYARTDLAVATLTKVAALTSTLLPLVKRRTFPSQGTATFTGNTTFQCSGTTLVCTLNVATNLNLGGASVRIYNTGNGSGYGIKLNQNVIVSSGAFQLANGARFLTQHA